MTYFMWIDHDTIGPNHCVSHHDPYMDHWLDNIERYDGQRAVTFTGEDFRMPVRVAMCKGTPRRDAFEAVEWPDGARQMQVHGIVCSRIRLTAAEYVMLQLTGTVPEWL